MPRQYSFLSDDQEQAQPTSTRRYGFLDSPETTSRDDAEDSGISPGAVVAGGGALAGLGYLASKLKGVPGIGGKIGRAGEVINAVRQQAMLSGFAPIKSLLGNVGAGVEAAVEGRGLAPLKEILSTRTLRDAVKSMRSGAGLAKNPAGTQNTVDLPWILGAPGRIMSGFDDATRAALQRAGATADEAEAAVLQTPLGGKFSALESPVGRAVQPFRRTPFNQWFEGFEKVKRAGAGDRQAQKGLAAYTSAGAAHGALTEDEQYPLSIPLATAASARYGLPYAAGALIGRELAGGRGSGGIAGSALPVSEYGFEQSVTDPLRPFYDPAMLRAIERVTGQR